MDNIGDPAAVEAFAAGPNGHSSQVDLLAAVKNGLEHILLMIEELHPETITDLRNDTDYQEMLRRLQRETLAQPPPVPARPSTFVTDNDVALHAEWTAPPTPQQNEGFLTPSSSFNIPGSSLRSHTIDEPVYGSQDFTVKDSVQPNVKFPLGGSVKLPPPEGILTVHFLTGSSWVDARQVSAAINCFVGAEMVLGASAHPKKEGIVVEDIILFCDSEDSADMVAALIQEREQCKRLWTPDAQIFVRKAKSRPYILALSMARDSKGGIAPRGRVLSEPWENLLPTLQITVSSLIGDVQLEALSRSGSPRTSPLWYVSCKGDPKCLHAVLGPLDGLYVPRFGFPVRSPSSPMEKYVVSVKVLCFFD